jgi:hypothetical protein
MDVVAVCVTRRLTTHLVSPRLPPQKKQSLLFAIHYETVWWIRLNVSNVRRNRPLIVPRLLDWESMTSWTEWKLYWQRFRTRVWPAVFEYQTTLSIMYFLQVLVGMVVSEKTLQRLTQHPYQRASMMASQSKKNDRVAVGVDTFVTCLWCNALFFTASYLLGQSIILYNHRRNYLRMSPDDAYWNHVKSSWRLGATMIRRYYFSATWAGIGSIVWPGTGTILGMGIGDGMGELTPAPELPDFGRTCRQVRGIFKQIGMMFGSGRSGGKGKSSWRYDDDDDKNNPYKAKQHADDALMCGCCQTTMFSSDPQCPERAPISSRECSHTICRQCVERCHLALMEITHSYQAWVSCPLCKAMNAFSPHNHLINRSLCGAIALIEQRQPMQPQSEPQVQEQGSSSKNGLEYVIAELE